MSPQHRVTVTLSERQMGFLRTIKERDGISEPEQFMEALRLWCESHDYGDDRTEDQEDLMREAERIARRARNARSKETKSRSK
jgi:hypothetical protein